MGNANEILVISLAVLLDIILDISGFSAPLPDIAALSYIFRLMVLDNPIGSAVLILLCTVCVDGVYFAGRVKTFAQAPRLTAAGKFYPRYTTEKSEKLLTTCL